jgi:hypothetical protein
LTQYLKFKGKVAWARLYEPDEYNGAVRWCLDFFPDDVDALKKVMHKNKGFKEGEYGLYTQLRRPTTKLIKGRIVSFTPPIIYDKSGKPIVQYVNKHTGDIIRSYDGISNEALIRQGEPVLMGNGSVVEVTLCVYATSMGNGSRLESVKLIDHIEYRPKETVSEPEEKIEEGEKGDAPW